MSQFLWRVPAVVVFGLICFYIVGFKSGWSRLGSNSGYNRLGFNWLRPFGLQLDSRLSFNSGNGRLNFKSGIGRLGFNSSDRRLGFNFGNAG